MGEWSLLGKFSAEFASGRILKIDQYLVNIWTKVRGLIFGPPAIVTTHDIIDVINVFLRFLFMSRFYVFDVFYFFHVFLFKKNVVIHTYSFIKQNDRTHLHLQKFKKKYIEIKCAT